MHWFCMSLSFLLFHSHQVVIIFTYSPEHTGGGLWFLRGTKKPKINLVCQAVSQVVLSGDRAGSHVMR